MSATDVAMESSLYSGFGASEASSLPGSARRKGHVKLSGLVVPNKAKTPRLDDWREAEAARDRRMAHVLKFALEAQDESNLTEQKRLDTLQMIAERKHEELTELRAQLALIKERQAHQQRDGKGLTDTTEELTDRLTRAAFDAEQADADEMTYSHMQEQMLGRRPHLVRKLHYLRSMHIELHERLATAKTAMEVALASESHLANELRKVHAPRPARPPPPLEPHLTARYRC